ncbi:MAG: nodulation protein NfeD [Spirochaetaceae bacterium]|jgi:membrane-bound serine protease (ClpP class)|nr:nodulation protein NfeD [Spirochaetaceae bacterium]
MKLFLLLFLPVIALADSKSWLIPIQGDIEPAMTAFVRRETQKALADKAEVLIFEIDTFGGRVDSALQITSFIMAIKNVKTAAWIRNGRDSRGVSWSAGALIALACQEIYMAEGTSIGAAAPITLNPDGSSQGAGEKTVSAVRSQMAALAERNGHPRGIALAMTDYDVALWEVSAQGKIQALTNEEIEGLEKKEPVERIKEIAPPGKLLSLTAGEAYRYGLAKGLADDRPALFAELGIDDVTESSPGFADRFLAFLTSPPVQAVLILLGLGALFLEIHTPGFGGAGTAAIICFAGVFGAGLLLGKVGSLEILLFLLGLGLLAVEIFVLPGFGAMGISGLIAIAVSLTLSMQDFILPRFEWEWSLFGRNAAVVSIGILAGALGIGGIALFGPRIRLFDPITLKTQITGAAETPDESLTGAEGIAGTILRPSGKAKIRGQSYSVETEGDFIEAGAALRVIRILGNRIIVQRA